MNLRLLFITVFAYQSITLFAQSYQTVDEISDNCAVLGFASNEAAELAVDRILQQVGLQNRNFIIQECPNINNAVAKVIKDEKGKSIRYILYDNAFFDRIEEKAQSDWSSISILAHEIGHHLSGHALLNMGSTHEFEIEADTFSGFVLAKMGATKEEAQSAIQTLRYEKATHTHPAKADRLKAIADGWDTAGANGILVNDAENKAETLYRKAVELHQQSKYQEAAKLYEAAAELGFMDAQVQIAFMYYYNDTFDYGIGVSYEKAAHWYEQAAQQGNFWAQYCIGDMYRKGEGVTKSIQKAYTWWEKATANRPLDETDDSEDGVVDMVVDDLYEMANDAVPGAIDQLTAMAEKGYCYAQYNLADYLQGDYPDDYSSVLAWYTKAGEGGYSLAWYELGYLYYYGMDDANSTMDEAKGIAWWKKAARAGNTDAQEELRSLGEDW